MASERKYISERDETLNDCKSFRFLGSNLWPSDLQNYREVESISKRLKNLPTVKARPGFSQRMAAAFATELERETTERNRAWLKKNSQISLPNITSDLIKDLF